MSHPVVGITGLNATDNPGPGVAVARSLREDPNFHGKIIGLSYDAMDPGLYMKGLLDGAFMLPYPSAGRDALVDRLAYVRERTGMDVLIPNLDAELPALCGEQDTLDRLGIRTFMPTREQLDARSKPNLIALGRKFDLPIPDGETLTDVRKLAACFQAFGAPIVVKSCLYGAEVCYTLDAAERAFHKYAAKWGYPILVQRFVKADEFCVCCVGDGAGGLDGAVPMKKLVITDQGKGWAGVTIADKSLLNLAERTMDALQWRGPCELEVLRDAEGRLSIIEINPRFPAWCDLTFGAGQNQPLQVVRRAMGEDPGRLPAYKVGTAFVRISLDQIVPIEALAGLVSAGEQLPESEASSSETPNEVTP
jgi:carbamoyl-phosphate synthase large subunit